MPDRKQTVTHIDPPPAPLRAHYVLSTHWDREWYQSFQNFRYQLVRLLDAVIAGLQDGRLQGPFQTDGQAIILEDYLEIRPDRRSLLAGLARDGKLLIGPWYVLPDEFLVSGESLVRNLRLGRQIARDFGGVPSNAGFVCDLFGHNSQMPQIFGGFGIRGGLLWRGLNHLQTRHVRWRGADGTELVAYRFPSGGYCDYTFAVRHAREHQLGVTPQTVAADLDRYLREEAEHTEVDPILLFDGGDHEEWDQVAYTGLLHYAEHGGGDFAVLHSSLDAYLAELLPQAARIGAVVTGELRDPGRDYVDQQWVIPGVLSSRVWIKQENAACEALLCQWAEPFSAWAHLAGEAEPHGGFLDVAWKWLLQNHPHDSICGCSIDVVHEDMKYRFSQARQIADRLTHEATRALAANVAGELGPDEVRVVVFNPLLTPLDEPLELELEIPVDWPQFDEFFGFEPQPAFRLFDAAGRELPCQRLKQVNNRRHARLYTVKFPEEYRSHAVTVSVRVAVPALGYTALTVRAERSGRATRSPAVPSLAVAENMLENEFLRVTVAANGTLALLDKRTGAAYSRLLTFEDCADIGDGWYHGQAVNDQVFVSTGSPPAVALVHNGPQLATLRIRTRMQVPRAFDFGDRAARTEELVALLIDSHVTLRAGAARVEVQTQVHNTACDHRLRVLFPTGADAATYRADTPFDVVERPIPLRADNHLYRELEVETSPQRSWTAVHGGGRGLAVVSTGLYETAVRDLRERPIALTLFRSTRRTVMTNGEPNGQLLGDLNFRFWLVPLAGAPDPVALSLLGQQIAAGLRTVQLRAADLALCARTAANPAAGSLLAVDGPVVVTSVRWVSDALELRAFNPTAAKAVATVRFGAGVHVVGVQLVDLESTPLETPRAVEDGACTYEWAPKQIRTLRFTVR
jgi:alpha-mannosidase/mannosylglycerate hydrolase